MGSSASVTHVQEYNSLKNEFVKQEVETQEVEFKAITLEEPEVAAINLTNLKKVFKGRIPVRAAGDKNTCFITGSAVLSPTRLVLVDNNNMAVKMVDTKERVVITTVRFKSEPRDVTVLTRLDAIAVTLPEEWKIQFLSTRYYNIFELLSAIVVNGKCECVDFCDGKLFVSYLFSSPSRVEIMTLDGTVLKVLKRDSEGNPLFTWPDYLTVWKDHIFISNYWNSTVLKLTTEGAVVSSYHDAGLRWPRGVISTGDGHILICSRYTNNIHIITDAGVKVGILLCAKDGLERPWSLCYCPASRRLYVSSYSPQEKHGNYIRVYQFKDPEETNVT